MKKKYTIEEFEKMFDNAVTKAIEELDNKMLEQRKKKNTENNMGMVMFSLQNVLAYATLKNVLFKED